MGSSKRLSRGGDLRALSSLYEATRAIGMSEDMESLLDEVLLRAEGLTGFEHWAVVLVDAERNDLVVRRVRGPGGWRPEVEGKHLPLDQGLCGWALRHGKTIRVGDVAKDPRYVPGLEGAHSNLVIPLVVGHEVVGLLDVESRESHAFSAEDEKLLTVLGAQAALAIVASRATEHLQLRVRELDALFRISRLVSSGRELDWVLGEMLEIVQEFSPAGKCAILLHDEESGLLRVRAARGYLDGVVGMSILPGRGVTGRCFEERRPIVVDDLDSEPSYIRGISEARSEIAVPMIAEGRNVGVLNAESTRLAAFGSDELRLFEIVARQAATVIQATRWFLETARLANSDPLTGLANRRRFVEELNRALRRAERYGETLALVIFDLDRFKSVNDGHGHEVGDRLLVEVARLLGEGLRDTDLVARLGGEEFGAILSHVGVEEAREVTDRMRRSIAALRLSVEAGDVLQATISAGVAVYPFHGIDDRVLMRRADEALYEAKGAGRDRVVVASPVGGGVVRGSGAVASQEAE
jgi:diguanylate cyclase (GGDEF)-like protein